jgi:hypothetical protein
VKKFFSGESVLNHPDLACIHFYQLPQVFAPVPGGQNFTLCFDPAHVRAMLGFECICLEVKVCQGFQLFIKIQIFLWDRRFG